VGNGSFFSDDNIEYQTQFLVGARSRHGVEIDYLGVWNERSWGSAAYLKKLRASLDAHGFSRTKVVGADDPFTVPPQEIAALQKDAAFSAIVPIVGSHYPCDRDPPTALWDLRPAKTFWANEDFSTLGGDWNGGSCWGRSLLQNYVKLNATSTVSWSTIWSVPEPYRYFGNGLMYAFEPWSGNYSVPPAVWTTAHVTQFAAPGWHFLDGDGAGLLPNGGSWTAMVPPAAGKSGRAAEENGRRTVDRATADDVSLVIEKLEGACLRCSVPATAAETVTFQLAGPLAGVENLALWLTNSTHSFIQLADVPIGQGGMFSVHVPRDTMLTLSTTTGQRKGTSAGVPSYSPHPFPYEEDYDTTPLHHPGVFHADNGGSFEVVPSSSSGLGLSDHGRELLQASPLYPAGTAWAGDYDPITSLGASDWSNFDCSVRVQIVGTPPDYALRDPAARAVQPSRSGRRPASIAASDDPIASGAYAGVCVRQIDQYDSGFCLLVGSGLAGGENESVAGRGWVLQAGTTRMQRTAGTILAHGALPEGDSGDLTVWRMLSLGVRGQKLTAAIDGTKVVDGLTSSLGAAVPPVGLASLRSGFHYARFDALRLSGPGRKVGGTPFLVKHLLYPPTLPPGGPIAPSIPRNDFTGQVGVAFTLATPVTVTALARFSAGGNGTHRLSLYDASASGRAPKRLAEVTLDLASATFDDLNGWEWVALPSVVQLDARRGNRYLLVSSETAGGDVFYDRTVKVQAAPDLTLGWPLPVYCDTQSCHDSGGEEGGDPPWGASYGPVNMLLL
jgi:hypothetical protein